MSQNVSAKELRRQSRALDRKKVLGDPILMLMIVIMVIFLTLFIVYPLVMLLSEAVYSKDTGLTGGIMHEALTYVTFKTAFTNTIRLGIIVGITSVIVGMLFAYIDVYVRMRTGFLARLFKVVATMPVVSPPFVLSLSLIMLFGRTGFITKNLLHIRNFQGIYGLGGLIVVQTLTYFPVCYLTFKGLLKNIDPSIEEAARDIGASRLKVFTAVTLPLMLPGIGNAFLVTFIESIADFANPMIIGGNYDTLATTIYLQITGSLNKEVASAMALVLLLLTMVLFMLQKYWLERKATATLTGKAARGRILIEDRSVRLPLSVMAGAISLFVIGLYLLVPLGSLFNLWGRDYSLTFKWYEYAFDSGGWTQYLDSIELAAIAAPICSLMSMLIAWMVVKKKFALKGYIEFVSMMAMAVPGIVLGIAFIRGFVTGVFHTGFLQSLYGTGTIIVIVFVVRSLPVGTRNGIAALRQIDKSIEEAATDLGANSGKLFTAITLPLIKDSFVSGLITSFVRSITAISAIILLINARWRLITYQISESANKGYYGAACAAATILIIIVYAAILLLQVFTKYFGTSRYINREE
ncbi:MAG: iron ABC transporter permease [Clostridia bacterium]|nr:iron ABC transporter permease [Clostridia bacterium]